MSAQPATELYLNLPVADLDRATTFYRALGFEIDDRFTDENAGMVKISETIFVMLLVKPFFQQFTKVEIADTAATVGGISCISVPGRADVDAFQATALAAGAAGSKDELDDGPLYSKSFRPHRVPSLSARASRGPHNAPLACRHGRHHVLGRDRTGERRDRRERATHRRAS